MTSLSEVSVVRAPSPAEEGVAVAEPAVGSWGPYVPARPSRWSPATLAALALLAGIGAMALGALAVVSASSSAEAEPVVTTPAVPVEAPGTSDAERGVLALLAKPSTERFVFRRSGGRLVLVVGSGGRAAIIVRRLDRVSAAQPYYAWVIRSGEPVRAARFTGSERAVLVSVPVRKGDSVAVGIERDTAPRPGTTRIIATRA
jgi:hypothetical protein